MIGYCGSGLAIRVLAGRPERFTYGALTSRLAHVNIGENMKPEDNQIPVADVAGELIRVALWLSTEHRNNIARHGEQAKAWHEQIFGLCQCAAMEVAKVLLLLPETEGDAGRYLEGDVSWLAYLSGLQKRYCGVAAMRSTDPESVAAAIEEIARAVAQTNPAAGPVEPIKGLFSPKQLAERYGLPADAVRKRLERYRKHNLDGWVENVERKPREPQYTYDHDAVKHVLDGMVSQRTRRTKTSSERPAKKI